MRDDPVTAVLLLSPETDEQSGLLAAVSDTGARVDKAASTAEALHALLDRDFDVLVMDASAVADSRAFIRRVGDIRPGLEVVVLADPAAGDALSAGGDRVHVLERAAAPAIAERLAEAVRRRKRHFDTADERLMRQILARFGDVCSRVRAPAAGEGTLDLMEVLRTSIAQAISPAAAGVLVGTKDETVLRITASQRLSAGFLEQVQEEMLGCYEQLTGRHVARDKVTVRLDGEPPRSAPVPSAVASCFSIPIVTGEQQNGVLTFASPERETFSAADKWFLCHLCNHVSGILPNLFRMRHLATRDGLTGLYNRAYFEEELHKTWLLGRRYGYPIGLIVIDVDNFKAINDSYGHPIGDVILCELARLLLRTARATDTVARSGGDEIAVILPNADAKHVKEGAERFFAAVSGHVFCEGRHPLNVSISVGAASSVYPGVDKEGDLMNLADRAIYLAKEKGKGRVCTVEEVLDDGQRAMEDRVAAAAAAAPKTAAPQHRGSVLVVDDEPAICELFKAMLREKGFNVLTESSARQAIEMVRSQGGKIDVALTDLRMPEMDGIQLLDAIHRISPDIVTVMATGYSSAENAIAAMRAGAYDFVRKPVDFNELEFVLSRAVERRRLRQQIELHRLQLESTLDDRTRSLRSAIDALENSYMATMEALSTMLAMREASTALHNKRVSEYSVFLARRMNLGSKQIVTIRRGALIHDIGKIGIPDAILLKPGPLTPEEWQVIRQHPTVGYQIVNAIPFLQDEAEMVLAHHERHDGKGYPRGQAGEAVCLGARIFAVVDAFDALRTDRVYRKAVSLDAAVKEIRANSGTQFDPAVVTVFLDTCAEMDHLFNR